MNRRSFLAAAAAVPVAAPLVAVPFKPKPQVLEIDASQIKGLAGEIDQMAAQVEECGSERDEALEDVDRLLTGMDLAWGLIANAYEPVRERGEAEGTHPITVKFAKDWKAAADRWRDEHLWYSGQNPLMGTGKLADNPDRPATVGEVQDLRRELAELKARIETLRSLTAVSRAKGNADHDHYLHGMANGMTCALHTLDGGGEGCPYLEFGEADQ